jgi:hypothetical protein
VKVGESTGRSVLWGLMICWCCISLLHAEVSLLRVSVEPGQPNTWTSVNLEVLNSENKAAKVRLELVLGELESGVNSIFWESEVPAQTRWSRSLPILIPSQKETKDVSNKKLKKMTQRGFGVEVKLMVDGALKKRDSVMGTYFSENPLFAISPPKSQNSWAQSDPRNLLFHNSEFEASMNLPYLGQANKIRAKMNSGSELTFGECSKKTVIWQNLKDFESAELKVLMDWVEGGGLLIFNSSEVKDLFIHKLLGIKSGKTALFFPQWEGVKGELTTGTTHIFSKDWRPIKDDVGLVLGAECKKGLGKIVVLNVNWNTLQKMNPKWALDIFVQWLPQKLVGLLQYGEGASKTTQQLALLSGRTIWSKNKVIIFLFSLLILAVVLPISPPFNKLREWRWGIWMSLVLIWTVLGVIFHLLSVDQSTRLTSTRWTMRNGQSSWMQEWGIASIVSGERRRFPLGVEDGVNWYPYGQDIHVETFMSNRGLEWSNFSLAPQLDQKVQWEKITKVPSRQSEEVPRITIGKDWELHTPKNWADETVLLVMGRQLWTMNAGGSAKLDQENNPPFESLKFVDRELIEAFLRNEDNSFNPYERVWLFRSRQIIEHPFALPEDVKVSGKTIECWVIEPEITSSALTIFAGTEDWSFIRSNEVKREDRIFDGVHFKPGLRNVDLKLGLPHWVQKLNVSSLTLRFREKIKSMDWKISYTNAKGQDKNLSCNDESVSVPMEAWLANQSVHLKIKARAVPNPQELKSVESEAQTLRLLGLEIKGDHRD